MKNSKQILSITSAAVDALSSARDVHKGKIVKSQRATSSIPRGQDVTEQVSSHNQNPSSMSSSTAADRVNEEIKDQSSSSLFEPSFNGTQRVRVPSRLLREIRSPLERSSSSSDSKETTESIVKDQIKPTPVKVVRHIDGPSAWISSKEDDAGHNVKCPNPVKTIGEPSRDDAVNEMTVYGTKENLAGQVKEVTVQHVEDVTDGQETDDRRKNVPAVKGLYQGQPKYGTPVFNPNEENAGDVKVKRFVLNDKEKALKEQFLKRQDQKRPVKKLVQPTVVSPLTEEEERSKTQGGMDSENSVATAAAIAAAAASAATGPFLQLQHSLEAQIAALVSNLQVLQQNHNRQQELQDKEKESKLQQQIEERLKRLEDLQANMLRTQSIQSAQVSFPAASQQPLAASQPSNTMEPAGMVPPTSHQSVPQVSSYQNAPVWQNDRTQPQYAVAGHYTRHESPHPDDLLSYPGRIPAFEKHKVVKNTRTQTSPQESVSSEESPLQTPLPRKRPPIPISRYDLPRTRAKRSDANSRRAEKKARVRFESDVTPRLPSYMKEMTHKGRGLVKELVSQDLANRDDETGMESRIPPDSIPVLPSRSETVALSNDVGKIKTELRDILTETERLKRELVQHQLAKDDIHSHTLPIRPTGPSPLDEYLETTHVSHSLRNPTVSRPSGFLSTSSTHHHVDAERILQDVQRRRQNLDSNLEAVIRQREEQDLYNLVDNVTTTNSEFDDLLRIRREVDKKIGEISCAVQREINQENQDTSKQKEDLNPLKKSQPVKAPPYGARRVEARTATRPGSITGKKAVNKIKGKENLPEKLAAKKGKSTRSQAPPKRPPAVTPAQKQVYLSSVYGRQPYHPQRTTSKPPYLHYQSPVNPKTAAIMAGIMAGESRVTEKPVPQDQTSFPEKEVTQPRKKKADALKPEVSAHRQPTKQKDEAQYFFHPKVDLSQVAPGEGMSRVFVPLEGQLVPMAIPLGKPKTNPALRPPIAIQDERHPSQVEAKAESLSPGSSIDTDASGAQSPDPTPVRPTRPPQPNVAVITMYDKELGENAIHQHKRQKKSPTKKKQKSLSVQVLPKVDIDSFSESASSTPSLPHVSDIPEPLSRPDDSEYQEFRNFLAVTETGTQERDQEQASDDADDDFHRIPTPQYPLTLEGFTEVPDRPYNGPPFPPVHPPVSAHHTGGVLEADTRREEALQDRAMEWIEQELLARIVSEMNQPVPDPTTLVRPQITPESSTVSEPEDEDADMLAATLGQGGLQLFIDAGLPVDRHLVTNLIREVIAENVSTVLGHPKPRASSLSSRQPLVEEHRSPTPSPRGTPLPTPTPTPEYTPPESEESAHESAILATPDRTPTPSVTSEELTASDTREEEKAFEPISEGLDKEEHTNEQISEVRTPVATPVPTPPGAQSSPAASVSTPEPSVREPELSQDTAVPTPTPSVVVKTPTPEPETEPELSIAEEPRQPTEPSVSQKELTPPEPAKPFISSPSSMSSTTLGTTTITTEEEMSEGEMIQPYVHAGMYSEGEFAVSPTIVQLAAQRKLPVGVDWDTSMLGHDEDSRNELVRVALNGLLQRDEGGKRHQQGYRDNSSSISDSMYQVSSASTLRDTEEIRQDSITDVTQSEGEVLVQDPMAVLLSRIQSHMRSADNSMASEGELLTEHLRMPELSQEKGEKRDGGEIAPGNISPGEVVWEPTGIRKEPNPVPADFILDDVDVDEEKISATVVHKVAPTTVDGEPSHDDRSLHASDLLPGTLGTDIASPAFARQQRSKQPRIIHVEEQESEPSVSQKTYSLDEDRRKKSSPPEHKQVAVAFSGATEPEGEEIEPQQPTKIQVTLPSIDDAREESSVASEHPVSIEQDTFGDVSSISGGDF